MCSEFRHKLQFLLYTDTAKITFKSYIHEMVFSSFAFGMLNIGILNTFILKSASFVKRFTYRAHADTQFNWNVMPNTHTHTYHCRGIFSSEKLFSYANELERQWPSFRWFRAAFSLSTEPFRQFLVLLVFNRKANRTFYSFASTFRHWGHQNTPREREKKPIDFTKLVMFEQSSHLWNVCVFLGCLLLCVRFHIAIYWQFRYDIPWETRHCIQFEMVKCHKTEKSRSTIT